MDIRNVSIDQVKPYWRNPRDNKKAIEAVKDSINKYGYNQPIVVDKDFIIIAGHTRYKALRQLDYVDIEVVVKNITEDEAKQYRIADNKSAELSEWDEDLLLYELREIEEVENMETFFDDGELSHLLDTSENEFIVDEEEKREEIKAQVTTTLSAQKSSDDDDEDVSEEELQAEIDKEVEKQMEDEKQKRMQEENEKIKRLEEKEKQKFQEKTEKREEDYIEIQCPHCDEKYTVSRTELLNAGKLRRTL